MCFPWTTVLFSLNLAFSMVGAKAFLNVVPLHRAFFPQDTAYCIITHVIYTVIGEHRLVGQTAQEMWNLGNTVANWERVGFASQLLSFPFVLFTLEAPSQVFSRLPTSHLSNCDSSHLFWVKSMYVASMLATEYWRENWPVFAGISLLKQGRKDLQVPRFCFT